MGYNPKILATLLIAVTLVVFVSAISPEQLLKDISKQSKNGQANINLNQIMNSANPQENSIPQESKQIAYEEIAQKLKESEQVSIIVWLKKEASVKDVLKDFKNLNIKYSYEELNGFATSVNGEELLALKNDERIDYPALDKIVETHLLQSRAIVQANTVESNYSLRGNGVGVCHLDTGINYNHPYLVQAYAGGYDFVNNDPDPMDDHGHGTATAGVIASNHTFVRGMAPKVNLLAVKVLNASGFGTESNVVAGINWCLTNKNQYNISVISMSLGTASTYTPATSPASYDPALQAVYNANIVPVASSGNNGNLAQISYPAVSPYVISVGATYDANTGSQTWTFNGFSCTESPVLNTMTCFGNRASFLDLVAPGAIISTLNWPSNFNSYVGTSFSAPHVSGTIALMKQRNPQMTVSQIENILKSTSAPVYDSATGITFKRINAWNAVNSVPYLNQTGTLIPGGVIALNINDAQNPGATYVAALSLGNYPGIPLPNGLTIPLNIDDILLFSLQPNPIITNNIGVLDNNGRATSTIYLPYVPGIQNLNIYSAFVTINNTSGEVLSISNSNKL